MLPKSAKLLAMPLRSFGQRSVVSRSSSVSWRCKTEYISLKMGRTPRGTDSSDKNLCRTEVEEKEEGSDKKEESGRRLHPEILYGFSVLSIAGVWSAQNYSKSEPADEPGRFSRFGVRAAEPIDKEKTGEKEAESNTSSKHDNRTRRQRFNFIADVVAETAPALVYIEIKDTSHRDYFTGQPVTSSNGSGFIVKPDGLILTNAHVVINKPRASIQVRLQSGEVFAGVVEDVDVRSDLATIRIPCGNLPVMRLGVSKDLKPGEFVVAMGSPLSLSNTITTGIVSNVARPPIELGLEGRDVPDYIQTDAAITFGNSGGPLINLDGEAIGINSMKVTPGISFAIPIDYAKEFLKKSEEAGRSAWPTGSNVLWRYIGITMVSLSPQMIEELRNRTNIPSSVSHGILIYRLVVGSPADRAGVRPGDIVTHINGKPIHGSRDVYKILEGRDTPLVLTVSRDRNYSINISVYPESIQ
ncbi:serine protease HTRA2, mitochondrial-like [Eurytemora carolleeae]|uniref:serine protease HTRA2, mitochondrial-like n=1 Tax=Eurytemora carolleeae TaxID=1294199 RepID=UPI000C78C007|nr:serine protease HTRA2, mitochondrial-like [Eurytemora carolleeae]|eukprot:XP_023348737.1 serine protease HTRA2, mitochondrial-like [Eurytemora affinis]